MSITTSFGHVQENLDREAVADINQGHFGRGMLKAVASGALDGILINGIILTGFSALTLVYGVVQKVKK